MNVGLGEPALKMSKVIGRNIVTAREAAGLATQAALARRVGVPQPQMSDWENGRFTPDVVTLLRIAGAIPCSVDALVVGVDARYDEAVAKSRSPRFEGQESPQTKKDTLAQKALDRENSDALDSGSAKDVTSLLGATTPEPSSHEPTRPHDQPSDRGSRQPSVDSDPTADLRRTLAAVRAAAKRLGIDIAEASVALDETTNQPGAGRDRKVKPVRARVARRGRR